MTPDDIWSELGLAPTDDTRAVRRAYAQRLKQTNPEDDPEAFKRLRGAYETALAWAEQGDVLAAPDAPGDVPGDTAAEPGYAPQPRQPPPAPSQQAAPTLRATDDPFEAHWARCRALVDRIAAGAPDDALLADLQAILAAPVLDHLEVYQNTGLGLARQLLELSPKGDALVWPVLSRFGWAKAGSGYNVAPEVAALHALGQRVTDRAALRDTKAYRLLTAPPPKRGTRDTRWDRDAVMRLIRASQGDEAWVAPELNADSVQWWARYGDPERERRGTRNIWLAAVGVLLGFIFLLAYLDANRPHRTLTPVEEAELLAAAADADPHDYAAWAKLCAVTARHWWRPSSINDCEHAAALNRGVVDTQLDLAFLYVKVGRGKPAEEAFDVVLRDWPEDSVALYGRSLARGLRNDLKGGREDWCRALKFDPGVREKIETTWEFKVDGEYEPC